jgi:hypothetical protein
MLHPKEEHLAATPPSEGLECIIWLNQLLPLDVGTRYITWSSDLPGSSIRSAGLYPCQVPVQWQTLPKLITARLATSGATLHTTNPRTGPGRYSHTYSKSGLILPKQTLSTMHGQQSLRIHYAECSGIEPRTCSAGDVAYLAILHSLGQCQVMS